MKLQCSNYTFSVNALNFLGDSLGEALRFWTFFKQARALIRAWFKHAICQVTLLCTAISHLHFRYLEILNYVFYFHAAIHDELLYNIYFVAFYRREATRTLRTKDKLVLSNLKVARQAEEIEKTSRHAAAQAVQLKHLSSSENQAINAVASKSDFL